MTVVTKIVEAGTYIATYKNCRIFLSKDNHGWYYNISGGKFGYDDQFTNGYKRKVDALNDAIYFVDNAYYSDNVQCWVINPPVASLEGNE